MTETDTIETPAPVCEPGEDPTDRLTIAELDMIGRKIGGDPIEAISEGTARRWYALALVGWCLDKRRDVKASEATWSKLTVPQLMTALAIDPDDTPEAAALRADAADQADEANPTDPTTAPE